MWPYPKVLAHRGGGILAPENTLAGLRTGLEYGFQAVEFDVMLSKDGQPVLMHDPQCGRTVAGNASIADCLLADLLQMDAGSWHSARFAGEHVPSYTQAVAFCRSQQIWMNVEIKPVPGHETETGRVVAEQTAALFADVSAGLPEHLPLLSSFSFAALMAAKQAAPSLPRGLLMDRLTPDWKAQLQEVGARALHTNQAHLDAIQVKQIKDAGYAVFCYTVNDVARAHQLLSWGVDAFCTDRLDLIDANF